MKINAEISGLLKCLVCRSVLIEKSDFKHRSVLTLTDMQESENQLGWKKPLRSSSSTITPERNSHGLGVTSLFCTGMPLMSLKCFCVTVLGKPPHEITTSVFLRTFGAAQTWNPMGFFLPCSIKQQSQLLGWGCCPWSVLLSIPARGLSALDVFRECLDFCPKTWDTYAFLAYGNSSGVGWFEK